MSLKYEPSLEPLHISVKIENSPLPARADDHDGEDGQGQDRAAVLRVGSMQTQGEACLRRAEAGPSQVRVG